MTAAPTGGIVAIGGRLPFRVLLSLARPPPAPGLSVWQSWGTEGGASVLRHRSVSGSLRQRMGGRRGIVAKQGQRDPPPRPRIPQAWLLPQPTGQGTPRGAEAREGRAATRQDGGPARATVHGCSAHRGLCGPALAPGPCAITVTHPSACTRGPGTPRLLQGRMCKPQACGLPAGAKHCLMCLCTSGCTHHRRAHGGGDRANAWSEVSRPGNDRAGPGPCLAGFESHALPGPWLSSAARGRVLYQGCGQQGP